MSFLLGVSVYCSKLLLEPSFWAIRIIRRLKRCRLNPNREKVSLQQEPNPASGRSEKRPVGAQLLGEADYQAAQALPVKSQSRKSFAPTRA